MPPGGDVIHMTIGEPRHAFPPLVAQVLAGPCRGFRQSIRPNEGTPELPPASRDWMQRPLWRDARSRTQIMALNGTREGLFNAAIALCPERKGGRRPVVLMPNPFYQVYAVAALAVGAEPVYVPATAPRRASCPTTALCTGRNPGPDRHRLSLLARQSAGRRGRRATIWRDLIALAEKHDFRIFADECYSEIWRDAPPRGRARGGRRDRAPTPSGCVIFHSLSKRSNLPGLRSGFVAGGPKPSPRMKQLRAYAGAPLPLPLQRVSEAVWADEAHVAENRALYQREIRASPTRSSRAVQGYQSPEAGFFLWLPVDDGEAAALKLWQETGVRVLPGAYLARDVNGGQPGQGLHPRRDGGAEEQEMQRGLEALRDCL